MSDRPFRVTPRRAIIVTLQLVGLQLGFGFALGLIFAIANAVRGLPPVAAHGVSPLAVGLANLGAVAVILRRELRLVGRTFPALGIWPIEPFRLLLPFALILPGITALVSETENLLRFVLPVPAWLGRFFQGVSDLGVHPFGTFFHMVIVAPVTEELLFRGLLLRGLLSTTTPARAIAISAALFAAIHLNPWQLPVALAYGVLLGWIYLRTRSLTLCIAGHAFNNLSSLLAPGLPFSIRGFNVEHAPGVVLFQPAWFDLTALALLTLGTLVFHRLAPPFSPQIVPAEPPRLPICEAQPARPPDQAEGFTL